MEPKQGLLSKFLKKLWPKEKPKPQIPTIPKPQFNVLQPKFDPTFESFNSKMLAEIKRKKALNPEESDLREDAKVDGVATERALLDQLLSDSNLYKSSKEYKELLDFTVRLRNMAPFNAMLLQVQKPGLNYAASTYDWASRFNRTIKDKARPLLIMWPFGPVALVYDFLDTEGDEKELPKDAFSYYAKGEIDEERLLAFTKILKSKQIHQKYYDQGDGDAGYIRRRSIEEDKKKYSIYELGMNRNHNDAIKFVTLAHELGHLYLGHLGKDSKLGIPERSGIKHRMSEIEAESVAYIICERNGITCRSQKYLNAYVEKDETTENLDLYSITRAAGHIERLLGLSRSTKWKD